jgi:two-component system, chemotaxis family, protein-glutamate methylesterase/glutaminase
VSRTIEAVAIGASAGGIDALFEVLEGLPAASRAAFIAVLHLPPSRDSLLPEIFRQRLALQVQEARPGAALEPGTLWFAPAGYHLLVEPDRTLSLSCDPPENYSRPSIDVMLESCAEAYGPALVAVLLTGASEDGARGMARVRETGGLAIVQDPAGAAYPIMPRAAIGRAGADHVLALPAIRDLLFSLVAS